MTNAVRSVDGVEVFVTVFATMLRERAELLRLYGASEACSACNAVAEELEASFAEWWNGEVTVSEAVEVTGYTAEHIRRQVRDGSIPHSRVSGCRDEIRISRCDLPMRRRKGASDLSIDQLASQILNERK